MSKRNKIQMPQSTAGLIRYFEESGDTVKLKPEHVVAMCIIIIALVLGLRFMMI